jgi:hypothetical protein
MVYVRTRTFCCCLPVRFGVFLLSIIGVIVGGLLSVGGWVQVSNLAQQALSTRDQAALYIQTVLFTLLTVVSIVGFIGAALRRRTLLNIYWIALTLHLIISIASGIFTIYSMFNEDVSSVFSQQCADAAVADASSEFCGNGMTVVKGILIAFYVITWLVQLYACIIVANYVDQLDEEKSFSPVTFGKVATIPVTTYNSYGGANYAFPHPSATYDAHGHSRV